MCSNINAEVLIHSDFSDGTTQYWGKGKDAGLPTTVETEEDGNKYLKLLSEGTKSEHPDKKVVFFTERGKWRGNYVARGVTSVTARFKNMGNDTLNIHLAIVNTLADLRAIYVITKGETIPNDGEWHDATFSMATEGMEFIPIGSSRKSTANFSALETLGNIKELKFTTGTLGEDYGDRRGPFNGFTGSPEIAAELWIDDIKLIK